MKLGHWLVVAGAIAFSTAAAGVTRPLDPLAPSGPTEPAAAPEALAPAQGRVVEVDVPAPALADSLLGVRTQQPVAVYLPPSYAASDRRYPVVYFLPGFGMPVRYLTEIGVAQGFQLQEAMDRLIGSGRVGEMIVVIASGLTPALGSFWVDSPVSGNWETFATRDLVGWVDRSFRTLDQPAARGLAGHSMGGFAALNLAMRHPELFGSVYSLSPGLFDPQGLADHYMFADPEAIESFLEVRRELAALPPSEAKARYLAFLSHLAVAELDFRGLFPFAYASAFAPKPGGQAPFIDYPYDKVDGGLVRDAAIWRRFEEGFGDLEAKVQRHREALLALRGLVLDYGTADDYPWIPRGCAYFARLLSAAAIPHRVATHDGDHFGRLRERLEEHVLPFFSEVFAALESPAAGGNRGESQKPR